MFRWCSYCQCFIGEGAPFEDFSLTHGICDQCRVKVKEKQVIDFQKINQMKAFYEKTKELVINNQQLYKKDIIKEMHDLNIKY